MSVQKYAVLLRQQWLTVLIAAIVGVTAGAAAFIVLPATYTANTTLYVTTRLTDTSPAAYQGALLSEVRTKSYTELVTNPRVAAEVVHRLGLKTSPENLASEVTATSSPDSAVIEVAVTDRSPQRAAQIANALGDVFVQLVDQFEAPTGPDARTPPISVRVWEPAATPSTRSSFSLEAMLVVGLFVGLVVGVALALLRNALDKSVRSVEQLANIAEAPTLAVFADNPEVRHQPLIVRHDSAGGNAEAVHRVRTHLELLQMNGAHRIFAVTSSLPGEGKTTIAVNLAQALGSVGHRVLLVEADLRRPVLAEMLVLNRRVGLSQVLRGDAHLDEVIQSSATDFDVIAGGSPQPGPGGHLGAKIMKANLEELRHTYDVILVDCPPLLSVADAAAVAPATDGAIVVVQYRAATEAQISAALDILRAGSVPVLGTILTRVPRQMVRKFVPADGGEHASASARTDGRGRHAEWGVEQPAAAAEPDAAALPERT